MRGHAHASRLLLIRHGETLWNRAGRWQGHADPPLSALGLEQARVLAEASRSWRHEVSAIYTSDLARAHDTAAPIAAVLGLTPTVEASLREMDVGCWSGLVRDEIRERHAAEWSRIGEGEDLPRGGGETMAAFAARIANALDAIVERHAQRTIAVVTHGGVIRVTLLRVLGLAAGEIRHVASVANTEIVEIDTGVAPWKMHRQSVQASP